MIRIEVKKRNLKKYITRKVIIMKTGKRLLAVILTLVLCIGILPTTVFAASSFKTSTASAVYYYTLKNVGTGKYLNVKGNSSANNANITLWQKDGTSGQNFALYYDSTNKGYVLVPECSTSRAVNIYGSSAGAGKNICTWTKTGHSTQAWVLKAVSGGYVIQSANNTNYVLTASGSSNGSNICIQKYSSSNKNQIWSLSLSKTVDKVTVSASLSSSSITKGGSISLSGTATSTASNLKTVSASIINSSGKTLYTSSKSSINSTSFSLSKLSALSFNKLSAGTYTLKVTATNTNGKTATSSKTFTVKNSTTTNTTSSTVDTSKITTAMKNTYSTALTSFKNTSTGKGLTTFNGYCGACVGHQLKALGITTSYVGYIGGDFYDAYKTNGAKTSGGYTQTSYASSSTSNSEDSISSMKSLLTSLNGKVSCTNGQYLMLGFQIGYQGNTNGHVILVYGIVDGNVYYTESFGSNTNCKSISSFCSSYKGYTFEGAVLFSK